MHANLNFKSILTRNHNFETKMNSNLMVIQFRMTFESKMNANPKFESILNGI